MNDFARIMLSSNRGSIIVRVWDNDVLTHCAELHRMVPVDGWLEIRIVTDAWHKVNDWTHCSESNECM